MSSITHIAFPDTGKVYQVIAEEEENNTLHFKLKRCLHPSDVTTEPATRVSGLRKDVLNHSEGSDPNDSDVSITYASVKLVGAAGPTGCGKNIRAASSGAVRSRSMLSTVYYEPG